MRQIAAPVRQTYAKLIRHNSMLVVPLEGSVLVAGRLQTANRLGLWTGMATTPTRKVGLQDGVGDDLSLAGKGVNTKATRKGKSPSRRDRLRMRDSGRSGGPVLLTDSLCTWARFGLLRSRKHPDSLLGS